MFEGLRFRLAQGPERVRVLRLRREIYDAELGYDPVDEFEEGAAHLIAATDSGSIWGAFRIVLPDQRPLELEHFINLASRIPAGRAIGQIGALWIHPEHRRVTSRGILPLALLKLAFTFARRRAITDLVMRTPVPQLCNFYRRAFFQPLQDLNFLHPVCGPVYVMHLDLADLESRQAELSDPVAEFLFRTPLPNIEM